MNLSASEQGAPFVYNCSDCSDKTLYGQPRHACSDAPPPIGGVYRTGQGRASGQELRIKATGKHTERKHMTNANTEHGKGPTPPLKVLQKRNF